MNETTPEWIIDLENKLKTTFINFYDFFDNDDLFTTINYIVVCNGLGLIKSKSAIKNYLSTNNFLNMSEQYYYQIKDTKKINKQMFIDHHNLVKKIKSL